MARHVFPNALYALVVVATLYIATAIRTEASLSFLGLGIPPPTPSWGNILSEGRQYIKCCPWITTFSGLAPIAAWWWVHNLYAPTAKQAHAAALAQWQKQWCCMKCGHVFA